MFCYTGRKDLQQKIDESTKIVGEREGAHFYGYATYLFRLFITSHRLIP